MNSKFFSHMDFFKTSVQAALFLLVICVSTFAVALAQNTVNDVGDRTIGGEVFNVNGNTPLISAEVRLINSSGSMAQVLSGENPFITSEDGRFAFTVVPGVYRLEVSKSGFIPSVLGGVDIAGSLAGTGGYFYPGLHELDISIPMREVTTTQQEQLDAGRPLFVTPEGYLQEECNIPPLITDITPIPESSPDGTPTISFKVLRGDPSIEGVDAECIQLFVNDEPVETVITGSKQAYNVSYEFTEAPVGETQVRIVACDLNSTPNEVVREFSFYQSQPDITAEELYLEDKLDKIQSLIATGHPIIYLLVFVAGASLGILGWRRREK